ncbi:unnamed protein product [Cuscuta europaea]|nr:unnamed protein product [Cuscuta europaea]
MVGEEKESNGFGGSNCIRLMVNNSQAMKSASAPGIEIANASGRSADASGNCLRTYKRRKGLKAEGKVSEDSADQVSHKPVDRNSHSQTNVAQGGSNDHLNEPINLSKIRLRNVVLEQIYLSLESESGLKKCIREALVSHPDTECATSVKESVNCCNDDTKCNLPSNSMAYDVLAKGNVDAPSTGLVKGTDHCTTSQLCQRWFSDIILSEDFSQLCHMIFENFEGTKADKFLHIGTMHSKMKDGLYEDSPMSFYSDIQEMWSKLHKVGSELLAISRSLSNKSTFCFRSQFVTEEPGTNCQADSLKPRTCKQCGETAHGTDSLVCDTCEQIYHVSCIHPAVKEIPYAKNWYCAKCTKEDIEHANCVVCERLDASKEEPHDDELTKLEKQIEMESSNGLMDDDNDNEHVQYFDEEPICNVCKTEAKYGGESLKMCSHKFCPHKFYHERCLSWEELCCHGPIWYCPSCLCRRCRKDCDDTEIVLCDGCDHAYHIYCMRPPKSSVPTGKWFCEKCEAGIQRISKVKRSYEKIAKRLKERDQVCGVLHKEKGNSEALYKSGGGGVDMLLNAAKTLNYEENLAVTGSEAS